MITVATVTRALRSLPTLLLAAACGDVGEPSPYEWRIPEHFPQPLVPGGSAPSEARVELGRHLFYEERLSTTGDVSCASCHRPELAFSDDRATSVGADGHPGIRNAPSLANVAYQPSLTWGNPLVTTLEAHALVPLFVDPRGTVFFKLVVKRFDTDSEGPRAGFLTMSVEFQRLQDRLAFDVGECHSLGYPQGRTR